MALKWLLLDDRTVDAVCALASASWEPAELDRTWRRVGWSDGDKSPADQVFAQYEFMLWSGQHWVRAGMAPDLDRITSLGLDFALYFDPDDRSATLPEAERRRIEELAAGRLLHMVPPSRGFVDPDYRAQDLAEFLDDVEPGDAAAAIPQADPPAPAGQDWLGDGEAGRAAFDGAWRHACGMVSNRLGAPEISGTHFDDGLHHAMWRVDSRVVAVAQGEDFDSYSLYSAGSLLVTDFPPNTPLPVGNAFYGLFEGDAH
ncbi:hypothetical protein [Actinokineospora sp.]|uniref:hypothetical protein n=1 Tax=Actinokineospora sp. TaxID=1872133 RepID=UPI004037CB6B